MLGVASLLREFEADFCLSLSAAETRVWSSRPGQIQRLAKLTNLDSTRVLEILGAEWVVTRGGRPRFRKE